MHDATKQYLLERYEHLRIEKRKYQERQEALRLELRQKQAEMYDLARELSSIDSCLRVVDDQLAPIMDAFITVDAAEIARLAAANEFDISDEDIEREIAELKEMRTALEEEMKYERQSERDDCGS